MAHFRQTFTVPATLDQVWRLHEDPQGLVVLTPPPVHVQILAVDRPLRAGSRLRFRLGVGPVSVAVSVVYEEFDPYQPGSLRCGFVDRMIDGPFRVWRHQHQFEDRGEGTNLCTDDVTFVLRGGIVGSLLSWLVVWPGLALMFMFRRIKTRRLLAQGWTFK